ncbi:NUDIX hydrolase [Halomicrobium sp. HM KBTZ05]|uniref:NUDIX hydrolase n=1 Tax=Halomicrobium sp. HM KBTZ05 TaxID=3242663 RepID=UPI003558D3AC
MTLDRTTLDAPRESQTIRLPAETLSSMREWAVAGTGLTAAARVRDPNGRTAFVKNDWSDGWVLPGGAVERDESLAGGARREVREETTLDADIVAPLVVFEQSYVDESDEKTAFTAQYVVYDARADGEIPDADRLGETDDEIRAARWFQTPPDALHDGDLLGQYLE